MRWQPASSGASLEVPEAGCLDVCDAVFARDLNELPLPASGVRIVTYTSDARLADRAVPTFVLGVWRNGKRCSWDARLLRQLVGPVRHLLDEIRSEVVEGFHEPRLDTLFLTLLVSWRGTIAQYAGRLHRLYDAKRDVRIYDYADLDVPMPARMFDRRCRGYEAVATPWCCRPARSRAGQPTSCCHRIPSGNATTPAASGASFVMASTCHSPRCSFMLLGRCRRTRRERRGPGAPPRRFSSDVSKRFPRRKAASP